jgi:BirA family transcriptional regulator, biotin operon repressor / biotin---[acetyl-CoA-carboxylase] ligase
MGVSAAKALESEPVAVKFKWPNDLIWNGKKLGGILCETQRNDQICVIAGIGINVNMTSEQLQQIDQPATSLLEANGSPLNVEHVIQTLQNQVQLDLPLFLSEGFVPFYTEYKRRLVHPMHQHMIVQDGQIKWEGLFQGIEPDGSLSLKLQSGEIKKLFSGEVNT